MFAGTLINSSWLIVKQYFHNHSKEGETRSVKFILEKSIVIAFRYAHVTIIVDAMMETKIVASALIKTRQFKIPVNYLSLSWIGEFPILLCYSFDI